MGTSVFNEAPSGEVADAIQQMNAARSALHASMFEAIVAYDRRGLWKEEGASCMAAWLATWIGIPNYLAQEWVRVAHALDKLPYVGAHTNWVTFVGAMFAFLPATQL